MTPSPLAHGASNAINRREFLGLAPRHLLGGIRAVLNQAMALTAMHVTGRPSTAQRIAVIDLANCLAWGGSACQTCYLQCPLRDEAITLDDGRPLVMASACNGCGVCVEACRAVNDLGAIRLVSEPVSKVGSAYVM